MVKRDKLGRFVKGNQIRLGAKLTIKQRKNISEGHKGQIPWNIGKKCYYTTKRNLENNSMKNPKTRKKVSEMFKSKHFSQKTEFTSERAKKINLGRKRPDIIKYAFKKGHMPWNKNMLGFLEGEKHYNWQGGLSFEPYDKSFNNKFKRAIRKRDNQICMLCGIHREKLKRALDVHHVDYNKKLSIPQNCVSLCINCHIKTNFNRKHWIKFFQNLLSEKYRYKYKEKNILINIK